MPPLLERHVVENDVGRRSRNAVHIPRPDGKGAAVVMLCDILNPILADVSVGAAVERDTADHTVFDILIVLEVVLVEIKFSTFSLTSNWMEPAPNAVGSSFSTKQRLPSSYDQPETGIFVMILTLTSSFANWVTSTEKSCISAFADAA